MTEEAGPGSGRKIVLLRHAKAEPPDSGPDADRELSQRGERDAVAAGTWLAAQGLRPDLVICSPASRTRQTWLGVARSIDGAAPPVRYEPAVYGGSAGRLLKLIRAVDPATNTVLLIGHNPTMTELSDLLLPMQAGAAGSGAAGSGAIGPVEMDGQYGLRTSGLVVHRFDGDWADLAAGVAPALTWHTARG